MSILETRQPPRMRKQVRVHLKSHDTHAWLDPNQKEDVWGCIHETHMAVLLISHHMGCFAGPTGGDFI